MRKRRLHHSETPSLRGIEGLRRSIPARNITTKSPMMAAGGVQDSVSTRSDFAKTFLIVPSPV
jgi:hypothetical protein